jgi:hypothetical protein
MCRVVLEERARTKPDAGKAKPEQFFDDGLAKELETEGFFKKTIPLTIRIVSLHHGRT